MTCLAIGSSAIETPDRVLLGGMDSVDGWLTELIASDIPSCALFAFRRRKADPVTIYRFETGR
jgi:hypothetical protein